MRYTLKELRARFNLSQKELADKIGVSPQTICAWEKDPGRMRVYRIQALCDIFGVRIDEIFVPTDTKKETVACDD